MDNTPNTNFYRFDLSLEKVTWENLTAEQLGPSPSPTNSTNPSSLPGTSKSTTNLSSSAIIALSSVVLGTIVIASIVVFSLIYRRTKKKNTSEREPDLGSQPNTILQMPNDDMNQHPPVNQQYSRLNQDFALSTPQHSPKGLHEPIFLIPNSDQN